MLCIGIANQFAPASAEQCAEGTTSYRTGVSWSVPVLHALQVVQLRASLQYMIPCVLQRVNIHLCMQHSGLQINRAEDAFQVHAKV